MLFRLDDALAVLKADDDALRRRNKKNIKSETVEEDERADRKASGSDRLPGLLGEAEGGGDLGLDVGGPPLLRDDVGQQVDQHLVVLQQRHRAVLPVERQVGPQGPDVHVDLPEVVALAGLRIDKNRGGQRPAETGSCDG